MATKDNSPLSTLTPLSKKIYEEVLTSHNISVLLLFHAYVSEKDCEITTYSINRRRGFCKLIQFLLQSPDFSFSQFLSVISEPKYNLGETIISRFQSNVSEVVNSDLDLLLNFISDTGRFLIEPLPGIVQNSISIHRSSAVGIFFRKMIVFLDKLTFSQTVKVYRLYQQYYLTGKSNIKSESFCQPLKQQSPVRSDEMKSMSMSIDTKTSISGVNVIDSTEYSGNIEISVNTQNPFTNPIVALFGVSSNSGEEDKYTECLSWSHRQMELFLAEQASFLQFDENSALPPSELQRVLNRIITINPHYSETYFVSYLNCLRIKEFNGAMENLFQFFDSVNFTDKSKSYRYAALNLAIFNVKFNNRAGAVSALKECIILSQEANDNVCLHVAQAWLRCLNEDKNLQLSVVESTVSKCDELELFYIASLSLQMCARKLLSLGQNGNIIFNLLDKSDAINAQHWIPDLSLSSIAYRASVWCIYGQSNIAFLMSQILLNIDTSYVAYSLTAFNTEEVCISICNVANYLLNMGKYQVAKSVLSHAKDRFPHKYSKWWKMCEQILYFEYSSNLCLWNDAYEAAKNIANIDKKESILRLAELSLERGDKVEAVSQINELISFLGNDSEYEMNNRPYYLLRAYIIGARAKTGGSAFFMLRKALAYSLRYGYPRFRAIIQLEMAKLQLQLGFIRQAAQLVEKSSVLIFSDNKYCEQAAALILIAKCNVALVRHLSYSDNRKVDLIKSAISKLEYAKILYQKLDCLRKVKDVAYFQAILANEIGLRDARNTYALEFRKIDMEDNQSYSCSSVFD